MLKGIGVTELVYELKGIGVTELVYGVALILIIVIAAYVTIGKLAGRRASKKPCPFCAVRIRADATVCRFCWRELPSYARGAASASMRSAKLNT